MTAQPQATGLVELERVNALAMALADGRCALPKGVYRFKSHEEANAWQDTAQARVMAELARSRDRG